VGRPCRSLLAVVEVDSCRSSISSGSSTGSNTVSSNSKRRNSKRRSSPRRCRPVSRFRRRSRARSSALVCAHSSVRGSKRAPDHPFWIACRTGSRPPLHRQSHLKSWNKTPCTWPRWAGGGLPGHHPPRPTCLTHQSHNTSLAFFHSRATSGATVSVTEGHGHLL
jgi:hypothetical protein